MRNRGNKVKEIAWEIMYELFYQPDKTDEKQNMAHRPHYQADEKEASAVTSQWIDTKSKEMCKKEHSHKLISLLPNTTKFCSNYFQAPSF